MYELNNGRNKRKNKFTIVVVTTFIVAMFITGYLVGASINLNVSSTEISELQEEKQNQNNPSGNINYQSITYIYNDTSLATLYENLRDSVVVITGYITTYSFFGMQYSEVQGSGFVYQFDDQKVIVTNEHVIEDISNLTVTFANGDAYPATVIGSDSYSDLAVLSVQVSDDEFKPIEIVSSDSLRVGDPVVAIGSPFGLGGTMTTGIVSQLGRTIQDSVAGSFPIADIIQTSVPINPGNSGGPLLNYQGEVIGITAAIIQNSNGLGFAIPSNTILREIGSLVTTGSYNQHPWLGISGIDMKYSLAKAMGVDVTYGWLITQVTRNSAADSAGLQGGSKYAVINNEQVIIGGDIIIAIDGTRIVNGDSLMTYLEEHTVPNQIIKMTIIRNNNMIDISVKLGTRPPL